MKKRVESADEETKKQLLEQQKHVILVLETVNQYQNERGLIFFDPQWEQIYMDSVQVQYEIKMSDNQDED